MNGGNKDCVRLTNLAFPPEMKRLQSILACGPLLLASACIHIKTDPVDVHMTVDVNVKVDRALNDIFGDLDKKDPSMIQASK